MNPVQSFLGFEGPCGPGFMPAVGICMFPNQIRRFGVLGGRDGDAYAAFTAFDYCRFGIGGELVFGIACWALDRFAEDGPRE